MVRNKELKMKQPVKLITVEGKKEKQLLKALLSEDNINYYAVRGEFRGIEEEDHPEDIYVEEKRLEDAGIIIENFQCDLNSIREFAEAKAHMIKPILLITLEEGMGIDRYELSDLLEAHHIQSGCETERYYEAGAGTVISGRMSGRMVFKQHIFVDEMYQEQAKIVLEEFFAKQIVEKKQQEIREETEEEDAPEEEYEQTEYTDCEFLPDRFFKWLKSKL